ncbi:MAG: DUF2271 domain-containing protein [Planctomycetales bacterium]|nr:DUF2271 domain-containing protein [Planctomycetales bacterium]
MNLRITLRPVCLNTLVMLVWLGSICQASEYRFFHENVLGTSMELRVCCDSASSAHEFESVVLAELDRLASIFSSYDATSEFSKFLQSPMGTTVPLSKELFSVLEQCDHWQRESHGAFNPAVETIVQVWRARAEENRLPTAVDLNRAVAVTNQKHWLLKHDDCSAVRCSNVPLSLNAIAKGSILDCVVGLCDSPSYGVTGAMLNIGGDIRIAGDMQVKVSIPAPGEDAIGGRSLGHVELRGGGIATSGGSERFVAVQGKHYSHILDPRSGMPVQETVSATVLAPDASTADVLATVLSVISLQDSLQLVNSLPQVECLLVSATGTIVTSENWPQADDESAKSKEAKTKADTGHEMLVEFEIGKPGEAQRYRRPYVAVWIEDKDKFPVKTLSLFVMQNDPGPRWYRDMRRWYADDQLRQLVDDRNLIETVSKPTRNPGKYKVVWDGRDDAGNLLKPGSYTLLIESAREHGSYQLIKHEFEFGGKSFEEKLKANTEIVAASVHYSNNDK